MSGDLRDKRSGTYDTDPGEPPRKSPPDSSREAENVKPAKPEGLLRPRKGPLDKNTGRA